MRVKKDRVEDALHATRAAVEEGVDKGWKGKFEVRLGQVRSGKVRVRTRELPSTLQQ